MSVVFCVCALMFALTWTTCSLRAHHQPLKHLQLPSLQHLRRHILLQLPRFQRCRRHSGIRLACPCSDTRPHRSKRSLRRPTQVSCSARALHVSLFFSKPNPPMFLTPAPATIISRSSCLRLSCFLSLTSTPATIPSTAVLALSLAAPSAS